MTYSGPARATTRRIRIRRRRGAGVLVAIVAIVVALGPKSLVSSSLTARSPSTASAPVVDSGWRSPAYQAQLLREAVSTYGSEQQAARWVATPIELRPEAVAHGCPAMYADPTHDPRMQQ